MMHLRIQSHRHSNQHHADHVLHDNEHPAEQHLAAELESALHYVQWFELKYQQGGQKARDKRKKQQGNDRPNNHLEIWNEWNAGRKPFLKQWLEQVGHDIAQ